MSESSLEHVSDQKGAYFVFLVYSPHAFLTFLLGDDFAGVLHDNLIRFESAVTADAIPTVCGLDHLYTHVILPPSLRALFDFFKVSVTTIRP